MKKLHAEKKKIFHLFTRTEYNFCLQNKKRSNGFKKKKY